jgi:hypothetical protein
LKTLFQRFLFAFGCFLLLALTNAHAQNYFRSVASGNWSATTTWQMSPDNITWGAAAYAPSYTDLAITIQGPNTVTINASVTIDEVTINLGGTLATSGASTVTINDGSGVDIIVNGTLNESATVSITWTASATWQMASNGTLIRTQNTSSNFWQQRYIGGIATIPATANWIIRKTSGANPSISSTAGIGGAFYPNLTIENNVAGIWNATGSSSFTGSTAFPTVKGNLDIGGTGTSTVNFLSINTNAQPVRVIGNLLIRTGNILSNYGTGFEVQGNLTVNGTLQYDASDTRTLDFAGGNAQTFSGTGTANIYMMRMRKTGNDLTLSRAIKIDNTLTFASAGTGGRIFSTATNLVTIEAAATATGASNSSHVNGPVNKLGSAAFTFPVGKNAYYRSIAMGTASGGGGTFWTETFSNGCSANCLATGYTGGPNGTWTVASTGVNDPEGSVWYVSCKEDGRNAGTCGTDCSVADPSLHVGSSQNWAGDLGAAYEIGGYCGIIICVSAHLRAESPTINCTGQSNIALSFNYIEFGDGTNDNATLWYYDGATWSQLVDLPKTSCCGGGCNTGSFQGLWTAYSIVLPASANNNPNVKIGFNWVNNDDGVGWDPSFGVDDITLGTAAAVDSYTAEYMRANPQVAYNNTLNAPLDHISQCEYWTLARNTGTQARTVTLSWDTPNSCGVTSLADLSVAYFNGASWDDKGNGGTTGTTAAGTIITASAVNSFGPFTLASITSQNPLPVYLVEFSATPQGNDVLLNWTTTSEINNDRFEIFSSNTSLGTNRFELIGSVKGNGNSTSIHHYAYLDQRPDKKGTYYYRLRQVDYDGMDMHSNIVAVNFKNAKAMNLVGVIPNPYTERTSVQIFASEKGVLTGHMTDVFGRHISTQTFSIDKGMFSFDPELAAPVAAGVYFVEIIFNDERIVSRLVKE